MGKQKAFPHSTVKYDEWTGQRIEKPHPGMDLRDYFAGKALQGFCTGGTKGDPIHTIADLAYGLADAMMRARKKSKE